MKYQSLRAPLSAAAVALLVAGCGGGGSGGGTQSLEVTGTAATGKALADASVEVKCAAGSGTATTSASGGYTVTIENGKLPCLVKVSGTSRGGAIVLHSAVASGTPAGNRITASANLTPITELVLAQLLAALPADAFGTFDPARITPEDVAAAAKAIAEALASAGIDLGTIDPLKDDLVAAHGGNPGNAYDRLLDVLAARISRDSLPLVANQVALAAVTKSTKGLEQAIAAVSGGTLANCPYALSGSYRTIDYAGRSGVRTVDFKNGKFMAFNGVDSYAITPDATRACQFSATGTVGTVTSRFDVVIGPSGAGSYRVSNSGGSSATTIGYIFPVQTHALSAVDGTWSFLQSGVIAGTTDHYSGQFHFSAADGTGTECNYERATWTCVPSGSSYTIAARSDGGFDVKAGSTTAINLWAYRAPNGSTAVFGTTNAAGSGSAPQQTSIVAAKLQKLALPAVGSATNYWDVMIDGLGTSVATHGPDAQTTTVQTVDSATGTVTRERASDGRVDTVHYNQPLDGVRTRDAGTSFAAAFMMTVPGMGLNVSVDTFTTAPHFYVISVTRP